MRNYRIPEISVGEGMGWHPQFEHGVIVMVLMRGFDGYPPYHEDLMTPFVRSMRKSGWSWRIIYANVVACARDKAHHLPSFSAFYRHYCRLDTHADARTKGNRRRTASD
jgi:hypothetical protein